MTNINIGILSGYGNRVLDVGCADGDLPIALKEAGFKVSAIDADEKLIEKFSHRPESAGIDIRLADVRSLPFEPSSFDIVTLIEVIEHIPSTSEALGEIHRILRSNGLLCVAAPTHYTEYLYRSLHPNYSHNAGHLKIFSRSSLRQELGDIGFIVIQMDTKNFVPALSWIIHAFLHSRSDQTGTILDHLWVDRALARVMRAVERTYVLRSVVRYAARYIGKSCYIYCVKNP